MGLELKTKYPVQDFKLNQKIKVFSMLYRKEETLYMQDNIHPPM